MLDTNAGICYEADITLNDKITRWVKSGRKMDRVDQELVEAEFRITGSANFLAKVLFLFRWK